MPVFENLRIAFLRCAVVQRVDHRQARVLLVLQDGRALVLSGRRDDRLRTGEERRHHHLIAEHEVIDDGVVAVELPAPGLGRRTACPSP